MNIGIDARMLGEGFGLARYVQQLVFHLERIDTENEYVIFLRGENWDEYMPHGHNFRKVLADIPWYSWQEQIHFKKIIQKEKVDMMHFPHWNVPILYQDPFVVTIHDLIMYHYPRQEATTLGPVAYFVKDQIHRRVVKHAVTAAKKVIVTSEFTKNDVFETLRVPREKMMVTYQAPFVERQQTTDNKQQNILTEYGITKPYVLYVGAAYPHKNLEGLIQAWEVFTEEYGDDYQLVLVGKESYFYQKLKTYCQTVTLSNGPVFTGFVPDSELVELYKHAKLYAFPSLYEGFGLPPLEAMAHGVPVVSSNRSCLPEVLGEAALYADPEDPKAFADAMYQGLTNEDIRFELKRLGREEVMRYSWEKLARETRQVYQSIR